MFTADIIDAATALSIGLVSGSFTGRAYEICSRIGGKTGQKAPVALRMLKESIHAGSDIDLQTDWYEVEKFCHLFSTGPEEG